MQPTISDHLIAFLCSSRSTKVYRKILWSRVCARNKISNARAFNQNLYRFRKRGLISTKGNQIQIHRNKLHKELSQRTTVMKGIHPLKTERILISFDIPEEKKKVRDWLRNQIKYWDFKMIHKSLWLGNGPLPKEFNLRLKLFGIEGNVKTFKVRKTI